MIIQDVRRNCGTFPKVRNSFMGHLQKCIDIDGGHFGLRVLNK